MAGRVSQAVIQDHQDVRAESHLNVDRRFGTQKMCAAVQMRLKSNSVIADVTQRAEAEDLIAAAVRQYRPVPSHEFMQAAQACDGFVSGPQEEVIRIAKKNLN